MKTRKMTDFSEFKPDIDAKINAITPINEATNTKHSKIEGSIRTEGKSIFICPNCASGDIIKNGKIHRSRRQQYRCHCGKRFSLSNKCVDIEVLIDSTSFHSYDLAQLKAQKKYMKRFDMYLMDATYTFDEDISNVIEREFKKIMKHIHYSEEKRLSKEADSFLFLSTSNNEDILYHTRFQHLLLSRNHRINFFSSQPQKYPLILCQCGSPSVSRAGYNNNGRRRLKCNECGKTFVIRLKNILPQSLFNIYCREYLQKVLPHYILIDQLIELLYDDLYHSEFINFFEDLVSRIQLISHRTAYFIMKIFMTMNMMRILYVMSIEYNLKRISPIVEYLDRTDVGMLFYDDISVTNIEYLEHHTNLDILKNNEKHIKYILKYAKDILNHYPHVLDVDWLLDDAVENAKVHFTNSSFSENNYSIS